MGGAVALLGIGCLLAAVAVRRCDPDDDDDDADTAIIVDDPPAIHPADVYGTDL